MPFVNSDGSITASRPFSLSLVISFFTEMYNASVLFFKTLIGLDCSSSMDQRTKRNKFPGGTTGWGSGGGGGGGGGGGPKRPGGGGGSGWGSINPRFRTMADLQKSAPPTSSCSTGSCPYN